MEALVYTLCFIMNFSQFTDADKAKIQNGMNASKMIFAEQILITKQIIATI